MRRPVLHSAALGLAALLLVVAAVPAGAASITINNTNVAGIGFNDPTPVAPVVGNAGTTLGQQRMNVFTAAAAYWSNRLVSSVVIKVSAQMVPLACTSNSALLGSAGPTAFASDFPHAPRAATWFVVSLASSLAGTDVDPSNPDIAASGQRPDLPGRHSLGLQHWRRRAAH
jgi:hypothetical protein